VVVAVVAVQEPERGLLDVAGGVHRHVLLAVGQEDQGRVARGHRRVATLGRTRHLPRLVVITARDQACHQRQHDDRHAHESLLCSLACSNGPVDTAGSRILMAQGGRWHDVRFVEEEDLVLPVICSMSVSQPPSPRT
jgi:hypothetical protein